MLAMTARDTAARTRAFLSREDTVSLERRAAEIFLFLLLLELMPGADLLGHLVGLQRIPKAVEFYFFESSIALVLSLEHYFAEKLIPYILGDE